MLADTLRPSGPAPRRASRLSIRRLGWIALAVAGVTVLGYAGICAYMALTLTRPERHPFVHLPEQFGLAYEAVDFPSRIDRIPLRGWLLTAPASAPRQPRPIIMVHGKGTDREAGPGDGIGERFTLGALEVRDVGGAIDYVRQRELAADGVNLVGFSMGGSTALLTAADEPAVRAVAEDSGYADLGDLLDEQVPKVSGLPAFFTPGMALAVRALIGADLYAIRPVDVMPGLAVRGVPVLIIHGEADTYVPPVNARRLAASYGPGVETLFIPEAGHVEGHLQSPSVYDDRLRTFLDRSAAD